MPKSVLREGTSLFVVHGQAGPLIRGTARGFFAIDEVADGIVGPGIAHGYGLGTAARKPPPSCPEQRRPRQYLVRPGDGKASGFTIPPSDRRPTQKLRMILSPETRTICTGARPHDVLPIVLARRSSARRFPESCLFLMASWPADVDDGGHAGSQTASWFVPAKFGPVRFRGSGPAEIGQLHEVEGEGSLFPGLAPVGYHGREEFPVLISAARV